MKKNELFRDLLISLLVGAASLIGLEKGLESLQKKMENNKK
jgi:hypothetical protein